MTETFDTQHPRIGDGTFTVKAQGTPEVALEPVLASPKIVLDAAELAAATDLLPEDVRRQVSYRIGEREIDDSVAIAGAQLISSKFSGTDRTEEFSSLGTSGAFAPDALSREIGDIYSSLSPRDRDLVSMIGTWSLEKTRG